MVYDVLGRVAPELGSRLHEKGQGPYGMAPFGHSAPVFPAARRKPRRYAAGGAGVVEFGSPVPEIAQALAAGFAERELLDWGGVALRLTGVSVVAPPEFADGRAVMRTATPVVMKSSEQGEGSALGPRGAWVLPTEPEWPAYFQGNLRRKAETLGVDTGVSLESVSWVGPKRSFAVGQGAKPGAPVEVELTGAPETLQALWSWGLGQANSAGFGWVTA
ncbi:CRISPR-associated endoribonuclease Cas6 [Kitasatospora sp. NPDC001664]